VIRPTHPGLPARPGVLTGKLRGLMFLTFQQNADPMKSKKNLTRFTYETTAFQGWRLCISRGGVTFTRYFSDKQCGGQRKALKTAEAKLAEMKELLDNAPRRNNKLTKTTEARARKLLKAG